MEIMSRSQRPSATSTSAASMRSSAGVWLVRGSRARASSPGVLQGISRGRFGSKILAAASKASRVSITAPARSVEAHGDLPEVAGHDLGRPVGLGWGEVEVAEDLLDDRGQERALLLGELHAALFDAGGDRGLGDVDEVFTFFLPQLDPDVDCGGLGGVDALEFGSGFLGAFGDAPDGGVGSEFTDFLGEPVDGAGGAVDLLEECVAGIDFSGESEHSHGGAGLLFLEASFGGGFGDGGAASVGAAHGLTAHGPFPALVAGAARFGFAAAGGSGHVVTSRRWQVGFGRGLGSAGCIGYRVRRRVGRSTGSGRTGGGLRSRWLREIRRAHV